LHETLIELIFHEVYPRPGHKVLSKLIRLVRVAGGAVLRRNDDVNFLLVVLKRVFVTLSVQGVALRAAHHNPGKIVRDLPCRDSFLKLGLLDCLSRRGSRMTAAFPVGYNSRVDRLVA
jgi:hypothetical protein